MGKSGYTRYGSLGDTVPDLWQVTPDQITLTFLARGCIQAETFPPPRSEPDVPPSQKSQEA